MTAAVNVHQITEGDRVEGVYMGRYPVAGHVAHRRAHTINRSANYVTLTLTLDTPAEVFGRVAEEVILTVPADGRPVEGFGPSTVEGFGPSTITAHYPA